MTPSLLDAPHHDGRRFFCPWDRRRRTPLDLLRWRLSRRLYDKRGPLEIPLALSDGTHLAGTASRPELTWVGHSTFAIHDGDDVVLTDPHFGPRALAVRRRSPPGLPLAAVPPHAFAVLSHNHYDHLDAWSVERLPRSLAWFVPLGLGAWLRRRSFAEVVELDWWQSARRGRWTLTCLPAQHWSRRFGQPEGTTLWCSWLLDSGEHRYFFGGDSGWFDGYAELGRRLSPLDVALLPIGAWEPVWFMGQAHLSPAEAWRAFRALGARHLLPMHWGAFDLADDPVDLAPRVLREVLAGAGPEAARASILAVGETWRLPD